MVYEASSDVVPFNHKTVHEFLESQESGFNKNSMPPEDLAMACLTCLNFDEFDASLCRQGGHGEMDKKVQVQPV